VMDLHQIWHRYRALTLSPVTDFWRSIEGYRFCRAGGQIYHFSLTKPVAVNTGWHYHAARDTKLAIWVKICSLHMLNKCSSGDKI